MLDIQKLRKEFKEILHSQTAEDLQEWLDMDRKRMAELEKKSSRLNGVIRRTATQPRAANGRFVSTKTIKPATHPAKTHIPSRMLKEKVAV